MVPKPQPQTIPIEDIRAHGLIQLSVKISLSERKYLRGKCNKLLTHTGDMQYTQIENIFSSDKASRLPKILRIVNCSVYVSCIWKPPRPHKRNTEFP